MSATMHDCPRGRSRRGFTLIETALTTVIIGVGTMAMMALLAAGTSTNQQTAAMTTAIDLANNIHELCDQLPYPQSTGAWGLPAGQSIAGNSNFFSTGNISWLDQQNFNPPIDATATTVSGMGSWTQEVVVNNVTVSPTGLTTLGRPPVSSKPISSVTVTILYGSQQVYQTSWLVAQ